MTQVERVLHDVFHKSQCIFLPCQPPRSSNCAPHATTEQPEGFINRFPDSVLLEIFAHLNLVELGVAAGVCRRWYALCHDPVLRRRMDVGFMPLSGIRIWRLLRSQVTSRVEELRLRGCFQLYRSRWGGSSVMAGAVHHHHHHSLSPSLHSFTLPELRRLCPALRSLALVDMALAFDTNGAVPALADLPPSLRRLALRACSFQAPRFFERDPEQLLSRLELLDLADCVQADAWSMSLLAEGAASLRALGLEGCRRVDGTALLRLGTPLMARLRVLDIEGCPVEDGALRVILSEATCLEQLYLAMTPLTGDVFRDACPSAPRLRRLCLRTLRFVSSEAGILQSLSRAAPGLRVIFVDASVPADVKEQLPAECRVLRRGGSEETCGHFLGAAVF